MAAVIISAAPVAADGVFRVDVRVRDLGLERPDGGVHQSRTAAGFYEAQPLPARTRRHLAEKPLAVMQALVRIVPAGGVILDPFMGSGTMGVAALHEGRRFLGVEISRSFFEVAKTRLSHQVQHGADRNTAEFPDREAA